MQKDVMYGTMYDTEILILILRTEFGISVATVRGRKMQTAVNDTEQIIHEINRYSKCY